MYIHRELEKTILPYLDRREALSILGPRQAGKTTFLGEIVRVLEQAGKKVRFLTFENRADLDLFNTSIEDFKRLMAEYDVVVIDEFQYAKEGGQKLKYLYDTTTQKFIVSGSSSLDLVFQTGKYMVGRLLEFTLLPFSFREFLSFREPELFSLLDKKENLTLLECDARDVFGEEITRRLSELLEEFVLFGGYPAVTLTLEREEKEKILGGIAENYLLKDIESLLHLATGDKLRVLEKLLSTQIGNLVQYDELSRASGLSFPELKEHLNILEKTYVLTLVKPFFTNRRTELTKNPKVFFLDLGLRNFVLSDFRPLRDRPDAGALMENYAYTLLSRRAPSLSMGVRYWRTKSKAEVDFVLETSDAVFPFEVKYSSKRVVGKSLHSFIRKFHPKRVAILTKDFAQQETISESMINFLPLGYF